MRWFFRLTSGINLKRLAIHDAAAVLSVFLCGIILGGLNGRTVLVCLVISILAVIALFAISFFTKKKASSDSVNEMSEFSGLTLDFIVKAPTPILICNSNGRIIWSNKAFQRVVDKNEYPGTKIEEFCGKGIDDISDFSDKKPTFVTVNGKQFCIRLYRFDSGTKKYYIIIWDDISELIEKDEKLKNEEPFFAYIVADSLDELSRYDKNGIREASNELETVLKEWADEVGGVIKEYRNDHYVLFFNSTALGRFEETKFDILDRIREIKVGESSFNVTVSIGISKLHGSLPEKEKAASEALDMALQRGGDQAVVKGQNGLEFYGGKTQTVQKVTKVRSRIIANELVALISGADRVIIMGHKSPDYDSIGACIGISRLCAYLGTDYRIIADFNSVNFIRVAKLLKKTDSYRKENFIEASEAAEYLTSGTLVIAVDFNSIKQAGSSDIVDFSNNIVYIDHHRKTAEFPETPKISYIEPSASSASELISEILEQSKPSGVLTVGEATALYTGIVLDTKQFSKNTGARTFSAALFLRNEGADPTEVQNLFRDSMEELVNEAKFESNVIIYCGCAIASSEDGDRITASKAADRLLGTEGVKASFALCCVDGGTHISCRSAGEMNVQLIAEGLGGGGHFDAAATVLPDDIKGSVEKLQQAIDKYIEENN
ncbi:MAG: DHH family phosphoesterase [Firmicutes bacterium]|nr:DHH family phosphoesterase [Candidatus Colimorpha enterica]